MRKIILLYALLISHMSYSQFTVQDIHFDYYNSPTDNDFTNHYNGFTGLYQIPGNGITGGCLAAPDSNLWGNDNADYCAHYSAQLGTFKTKICFKYDSTIVNPNSYDRAASIWMVPGADFNHYLIASIMHDKRLQVISYGWVSPSGTPLNLQHNYWYSLELTATFASANQVNVSASVFSLGASGLVNPSITGATSGNFIDNILTTDTSITVSITGARYGGGLYLDNFHFEGNKGSDNCVNTVGIDYHNVDNFEIKQTDKKLLIINNATQKANVSIINMSGGEVFHTRISADAEFDISHYPAGIYMVSIVGDKGRICGKIVVR